MHPRVNLNQITYSIGESLGRVVKADDLDRDVLGSILAKFENFFSQWM